MKTAWLADSRLQISYAALSLCNLFWTTINTPLAPSRLGISTLWPLRDSLWLDSTVVSALDRLAIVGPTPGCRIAGQLIAILVLYGILGFNVPLDTV